MLRSSKNSTLVPSKGKGKGFDSFRAHEYQQSLQLLKEGGSPNLKEQALTPFVSSKEKGKDIDCAHNYQQSLQLLKEGGSPNLKERVLNLSDSPRNTPAAKLFPPLDSSMMTPSTGAKQTI